MCSLLLLSCIVIYASGFGAPPTQPKVWRVTQPDPCPTHCGQSNQTLFGSVRCSNRHGGRFSDYKCAHLEKPPQPNVTCPSTHECTWAMGENCKDVCESLDATTECDLESMRMFGRYDFYLAEDMFGFECTEYNGANFWIRHMPYITTLGQCTYAGNANARPAIQCDNFKSGDQRICACKMPNPTASPSVSPTLVPSHFPTPAPTGPSKMPSWSPTKYDPGCDFSAGNRKVLTPISMDDCPEDFENVPVCNGNERPGIDSFQVGEICQAFGLIDWFTPSFYYLRNCNFRSAFRVECAPRDTPDVCPSAPLVTNAEGAAGSCGSCFSDAYCRYYCMCSRIGLSFVDDCAHAEFDGQQFNCVLKIGETVAPSLTPTRLPTATATTHHPTPDILGEICDQQTFQIRFAELSSCLNSGSLCCEEYGSVLRCPLSSQLGSNTLTQLRLSCRQSCSTQPECHSTTLPTTTFRVTTSQPITTFPPIIPTMDNNDCGLLMLISYQSELRGLATCLSETHTISVHGGNSCCPRYRPILTSPCRFQVDNVEELRRTCSTICTDQYCPNDQQITKSVRLNGDFESIVAPDKRTFLAECSAHLSPINCIDARSGSIIIDLQGPSDELQLRIQKIQMEGMQLPSYPALEMLLPEEVNEQEDSSVAVEVVTMIILLSLIFCSCCLGLCYYSFGYDIFGKSSHVWFEENPTTIQIQQDQQPNMDTVEGVERETTAREIDLEIDWNECS